MYGKSVFRVASLGSVRFYKHDSTKRLLEFLADMPKTNTARIASAQRQRQQISKKGQKYELHGASTVYLQVLGSGARGVPGTLYLFTDQKRYLFNCGECTQRLAHEHKVKLSRLEHIFITSKTWKNIGGLPGLSLTLQDVGVPKITLHGPDGLDELYNATKRFVIMKDMEVAMAKCSPSEDFEDNIMTVKFVLLAPTVSLLPKEPRSTKRPRYSEVDKELYVFTHDETDYYQRETRKVQDPKGLKKIKSIRPNSQVSDNTKTKTEKVLLDLQMKNQGSVSYICTLKKRLGTLDLAKCVELGVKPGPMLGQLKAGQDVILPDGTLVLSKDVKTPDDPGPVFIVLDVPVISYLKPEDFAAHFYDCGNPPENVPSLIVHMTPPHVYHDPAYKAFMSLFGPTCRHLVLNSQNSCMGSEAVHRTQHKLHLLDPDIFPLLRDISVPAEWNAKPPVPKTNSPIRLKGLEDLKNRIAIAQFQNIIQMESSRGDGAPPAAPAAPALDTHAARTLTTFHLRPKKHLDRSAEPKLHVHEYYQETMDVDGFVNSLESFRRLVDGVRFARTASTKEFPKIVFLGTGSCIPSKTRNTSGIVLHIDESSTMLLDCGEGTFGQMVRFYGPRKVNDVLRTIKAIYISHLHADHHIGLIGVLQARAEALRQEPLKGAPVFLMAPGQIISWLSVYDMHFERIATEFTLVPNQNLMDESHLEMTSANLASVGIEAVQTCLVPHCPNAFGVALSVAGHKVTYSGDTLPTDNLVKIGQNSTILIHEATMEDELEDEARTKMHSTTSQAIEVGRKMNAQYTVLTHFSQRYARLPRLNSQILHDNNTVGIAFDNMQITLNDLELLPHMYAPLQLMFAEHCVEMELKAAHRERRRERRSSSPNIPGKPIESHAAGRRNTYPRLPPCRPIGPKPQACHEGDTRQSAPSKPSAVPPRHEVFSIALNKGGPMYRESNSSRLRQQSRGMSVTSTIRPPRPKSSSPCKRQAVAPHEESTLPDAPPQNGSPDKFGVDLIHSARGSLSEESSISKDAQEGLRVFSPPPSSCDVDSRMKIRTGSINSSVSLRKNSGIFTAPYDVNGYGKPLVTPVTRKLVVRRETGNFSSINIPTRPAYKKPVVGAVKSPTRNLSAEKAEHSAASLPKTMGLPYCPRNKPRPVNSVSKSGVAENKLRCSVTNPNVRLDRSPLGRTPAPTNGPRPVTLGSRFTSKSLPPPGTDIGPTNLDRLSAFQTDAIQRPNRDINVKSAFSNTKPTARDTRSWTPESTMSKNNSPSRTSTKPSAVSCKRTMMKEALNKPGKENSIRPCSKDIKQLPFNCKPFASSHGSRGFKPQLEDIKSSYLLLHRLQGKEFPPVRKPEPFSESKRKEILLESKNKFQSKNYHNKSTLLLTMLKYPAVSWI